MRSQCNLFHQLLIKYLVQTLWIIFAIFSDEIQLSGDWTVAIIEILFPTKTEHVVNGDLRAYSIKGYED